LYRYCTQRTKKSPRLLDGARSSSWATHASPLRFGTTSVRLRRMNIQTLHGPPFTTETVVLHLVPLFAEGEGGGEGDGGTDEDEPGPGQGGQEGHDGIEEGRPGPGHDGGLVLDEDPEGGGDDRAGEHGGDVGAVGLAAGEEAEEEDAEESAGREADQLEGLPDEVFDGLGRRRPRRGARRAGSAARWRCGG
jgi:hypothetical protein